MNFSQKWTRQETKLILYKENINCIGTNKYLWINPFIQFLSSQISRGWLRGTMKRQLTSYKLLFLVKSNFERNLLRSHREELKSIFCNTKKGPLSQLLLHSSFFLFLNLLSWITPSIAYGSAMEGLSSFLSSWIWSDVEQRWVLLTE